MNSYHLERNIVGMRIGLIADLAKINLDQWLSTYALYLSLKSMGHLPIVINHPDTEDGIDIARLSENGQFSYDIFTVVEGASVLTNGWGVYQLADTYLTTDSIIYKKLNRKEEGYYPLQQIIGARLLIPQKEYHGLAKRISIKKNFILIYLSVMTEERSSFINDIVQERQVRVVANIKRTNIQGEVTYMEDSIREFLYFLRHSEFVITDNSTGAEMALLYEKPFLVLNEQEKVHLNLNFLSELKQENHVINSLSSYDKTMSYEINDKKELKKLMKLFREKEFEKLKVMVNRTKDQEYVDCPTDILKSECCGCSACMEVCPTNAITMVPDEEGFIYPVVDREKCIDCMLCKKSCVKRDDPQTVEYVSIKTYPVVLAVVNKSLEIRMGSSSGGVFPELARYAIEERNGYVVGVKFDEQMRAVSDIAHTMEEVRPFYGAKYVKSEFSHVFKPIKELLNAGEFVLYSALPCEAASLRAYLRKDYENLVICEVLCHAGPSPKVFAKYIDYINSKFGSKVTNVKFRDKRKGWVAVDNTLVFEFTDREPLVVNARKNNYYRNFIKDVIVRPSCADCAYVYDKRVGDITMGDFWGVQYHYPHLFDNKGTSILMLNNEKGALIWDKIKERFRIEISDLKTAFQYNHKHPIKLTESRKEFFSKFDQEPINELLENFNDLKKVK